MVVPPMASPLTSAVKASCAQALGNVLIKTAPARTQTPTASVDNRRICTAPPRWNTPLVNSASRFPAPVSCACPRPSRANGAWRTSSLSVPYPRIPARQTEPDFPSTHASSTGTASRHTAVRTTRTCSADVLVAAPSGVKGCKHRGVRATWIAWQGRYGPIFAAHIHSRVARSPRARSTCNESPLISPRKTGAKQNSGPSEAARDETTEN